MGCIHNDGGGMTMPQNYLDYEVYRDLSELADVYEQLMDGEL